MANGAPTVSNGLVISGVTTSTTFKGALQGTSGTFSSNVDITGDLDVNGHTDLDNVSISGITTFAQSAGAVTVPAGGDIRIANSGGWSGEYGGKIQQYLNFLYIQGGTSGIRLRHSDGNDRWVIDSNGHFVAGSDSTYDIGTTGVRVRNGYFDTLYGDGSNLTGISAGTSLSGSTNNTVCTVTGANAITGEANLTFDGSLLTVQKRMVIGNGTDFQIPSRSNTSSYTPQLQVTGAWNDPTHGGTLALNGRNDYPLLWMNSGASYQNNSGAGYIIFSIKDGAGNYCNTASIRSLVDGTPGNNNSPGDLTFMTTPSGTCNPVARMTIDSTGQVTKPAQASFAAMAAQNGYVLNGAVFPFNTTTHNIGSHFNTSNYRFTAPVAGRYLFTFYSILNSSGQGRYEILINGAADQNGTRVHMTPNTTNWDHVSTSWILNLAANDYIQMYSNSNTGWHGNHWQRFCGELLS